MPGWLDERIVAVCAGGYCVLHASPSTHLVRTSPTETEAGLRLCAELRIWSCGCDACLNYDYGNSDKKGRSVKE
jgi:hypothetical protein